jgi:ribosomal-protein-alanine N-acetyltransferase
LKFYKIQPMLILNFNPFPNLESERLLLRRIDKNDMLEIFAIRSDVENMKYIPRPLVKNHEEAMEHLAKIDSGIENNEAINWAITIKGNPKLVGIIGYYRTKHEHYRSEIGYMLLPEIHGKGIASEAVGIVMKFGFNEMKLHSIEAVIDPENGASEKVLQKNGFVKEAYLKENEFFEGKFIDSVIYSRLNEEQ